MRPAKYMSPPVIYYHTSKKKTSSSGESHHFFPNKDLAHLGALRNDAHVITVKIKGSYVKQTLGDESSSLYILFLKTLEKLGWTRDDLKKVDSILFGFTK